MNTKHTPGEWKASPVSSVVGSLITADGVSVATALPRMTAEEVQANALLIAAGPNLLAAVLAVKKAIDLGIEVRGLGEQILLGEAIEKCRTALAKATGEEVKA